MSEEQGGELKVPCNRKVETDAFEVVRVWLTKERIEFSLKCDAWDDPAAWGLLLVDLARHVANGRAQSSAKSVEVILSRIKEGFDVEWNSYTSDATGEVAGEGG